MKLKFTDVSVHRLNLINVVNYKKKKEKNAIRGIKKDS